MLTETRTGAMRNWWSLTGEIAAWARRILHTARTRRALKRLLDKDDRILDDIGVTRDEIRWALSLPSGVSPARALAEEARCRRKAEARA